MVDGRSKARVNRYEPPAKPHISIISADGCAACSHQACLTVCPTNVFMRRRGGRIAVEHKRCVECCACWIACPDNIDFSFPADGGGIIHRFG